MSKYIKQDDVFELVRTGVLVGNSNFESVSKYVGSLPTIEIVRCRECKYYEDPNHKIFENCVKWKDSHGILLPMKPNDSCSYGERLEQ